jgi:hypothetical protein
MNDDAWPAACGVLEQLKMECRTAKFGSLPPTNIHFWSTNDSTSSGAWSTPTERQQRWSPWMTGLPITLHQKQHGDNLLMSEFHDASLTLNHGPH